MGKKKPQKTKQVSVAAAIEDASSAAADASGEEIKLPNPPRKRGRPRKVVGIQQPQLLVQAEEQVDGGGGGEQSKKAKAIDEQEEEEEERQAEEKSMVTRSRARRKSIPRKSS